MDSNDSIYPNPELYALCPPRGNINHQASLSQPDTSQSIENTNDNSYLDLFGAFPSKDDTNASTGPPFPQQLPLEAPLPCLTFPSLLNLPDLQPSIAPQNNAEIQAPLVGVLNHPIQLDSSLLNQPLPLDPSLMTTNWPAVTAGYIGQTLAQVPVIPAPQLTLPAAPLNIPPPTSQLTLPQAPPQLMHQPTQPSASQKLLTYIPEQAGPAPGKSVAQRPLRTGRISHKREMKNDPDNNPSLWYAAPIRPPRSWGRFGSRTFKYTNQGELELGKLYTRKQIQDFIFVNAPDREHLTLWVQSCPAATNHRYPHISSSKCRWEYCQGMNNTIMKGDFRIAFDEKSLSTTAGGRDPFHNAGYMHLYCMERCFDLIELFDHPDVDIRADLRDLPGEERNPASLHREYADLAKVLAEWRREQLAKYRAWKQAYDPCTTRRQLHYKHDYLFSRLTEAVVQGGHRQAQRAKRNGQDIAKHGGDLEERNRLLKAKKKEKQEAKRKAAEAFGDDDDSDDLDSGEERGRTGEAIAYQNGAADSGYASPQPTLPGTVLPLKLRGKKRSRVEFDSDSDEAELQQILAEAMRIMKKRKQAAKAADTPRQKRAFDELDSDNGVYTQERRAMLDISAAKERKTSTLTESSRTAQPEVQPSKAGGRKRSLADANEDEEEQQPVSPKRIKLADDKSASSHTTLRSPRSQHRLSEPALGNVAPSKEPLCKRKSV